MVGASGYVGRAVVAELRARAVPTLAHVRADSTRLAHWRAHFGALSAEVVTTAWDRQDFATLLRENEVSHVFLCLGTTLRRRLTTRTSGVADSYAGVDYGLSAVVIDACVESAARPKVVLLSSAGARAAARSAYLSARGRLEDHLRASGLEFIIARPSFISGPGRGEFRPFERLAAGIVDWSLLWGAVLGMQILRERYRSIGAQELAKALVSHAQEPLSQGKLLLGERLRDFP